MAFLIKGALIEYSGEFLGPIPNVVLFQFNPEKLGRTIQVPPRPTGGKETSQAGDSPIEKIALTAHFSAADGWGKNDPLSRMFGVGHQLAALEKMVRPSGPLTSALASALTDKLGGEIQSLSSGEGDAVQPVPREKYPRILFIWGKSRVLPVIIESMVINELQYDNMLNPVLAEVSIGLAVTIDHGDDDQVASGALDFTNLQKDNQALANLAASAAAAVDLIPF